MFAPCYSTKGHRPVTYFLISALFWSIRQASRSKDRIWRLWPAEHLPGSILGLSKIQALSNMYPTVPIAPTLANTSYLTSRRNSFRVPKSAEISPEFRNVQCSCGGGAPAESPAPQTSSSTLMSLLNDKSGHESFDFSSEFLMSVSWLVHQHCLNNEAITRPELDSQSINHALISNNNNNNNST